MTSAADVVLEVTGSADVAALAAIREPLAEFNEAQVGASHRQSLAVLIREGGAVIGGLAGHTAWDWLYVQWLFVPERLRGHGLAGRLLLAAETEARSRGCLGVWIDTFSDTALRTYKKQGYTLFGELADFPAGRKRWFLQKRLHAGDGVTPA